MIIKHVECDFEVTIEEKLVKVSLYTIGKTSHIDNKDKMFIATCDSPPSWTSTYNLYNHNHSFCYSRACFN